MEFFVTLLGLNLLALPSFYRKSTSRPDIIPEDLTYTEYLHCIVCLLTTPRDHIERCDRLHLILLVSSCNLATTAIWIAYQALA